MAAGSKALACAVLLGGLWPCGAACAEARASLQVGAIVVRPAQLRTTLTAGRGIGPVTISDPAAANVTVTGGSLAKNEDGQMTLRARLGERLVVLSVEY